MEKHGGCGWPTPAKPLPSDEERAKAKEWLQVQIPGRFLYASDVNSLAALLAQVRVEASREKDAEIERLKWSRASADQHDCMEMEDAYATLREENARLARLRDMHFNSANERWAKWQEEKQENAALRERVKVLERIARRLLIGIKASQGGSTQGWITDKMLEDATEALLVPASPSAEEGPAAEACAGMSAGSHGVEEDSVSEWDDIEAYRERQRAYEELARQRRYAEASDARYDNWGRAVAQLREALLAPASEPAKIGHRFEPCLFIGRSPEPDCPGETLCHGPFCARPESEHEPAPEKE